MNRSQGTTIYNIKKEAFYPFSVTEQPRKPSPKLLFSHIAGGLHRPTSYAPLSSVPKKVPRRDLTLLLLTSKRGLINESALMSTLFRPEHLNRCFQLKLYSLGPFRTRGQEADRPPKEKWGAKYGVGFCFPSETIWRVPINRLSELETLFYPRVHIAITKIRHFHQMSDDPINREYVSCSVPPVLNSTSRMSKIFHCMLWG